MPCRRLHHLGAHRHRQARYSGALPQRDGQPSGEERPGAGRPGAAVLLREQDCAQDTLYETASLLLREKGRRENMEKALRAMAVPDAGEKIYETLREIMK